VRIASKPVVSFALIAALQVALAAAPAGAAPVVFAAVGANSASIQTTVDAFRSSLGTLNPNVAGTFGSGRREINWDGVPDAFAAPNGLPANFFNVNSPRGLVFSTPGSSFQVSANPGVAPVRFDNINPTYSSAFSTFSAPRLFTAVGSNTVDVTFFVPGTSTPASVSAFGAVFTDVDIADTTALEFFDPSNNSLGSFAAPAAAGSATQSFVGVVFNAGERIARVRISSGNAALGAGVNDGGTTDLVVMDDFVYAEPQALVGAICTASPPVGTPLAGFNVVVAQPGVTTLGTSGADLVYGTAGEDEIAALGGNDIVLGSGGNDRIAGGDGDDTLCGGDGNDLLAGGTGSDVVSGDSGNDDLSGGPGDDRMFGGTGIDRLSGGDGTDTCSPGADAGDVALPAPSCDTIT
jgi:hypothetical protein